MRKVFAAVLAMLLAVSMIAVAAGEKARGIRTVEDETFHAQHLINHLNDVNCCMTGNYIKVRTSAESNAKVIGHAEQADEFVLLELSGGYARIRVLRSHESSPDSWDGMEGWVTAAYVDCECSDSAYYSSQSSTGVLTGGYFPAGMPAVWYFSSGAGAWGTELTVYEDGSFDGYYHDWDGGITDSSYPRGVLQECCFSGRLSRPERISAHEYSIVVVELVQEGTPGEQFIRDEMLVTISHPYGIGKGDMFILYMPGTPINRIPPAYHEWAVVAGDEWNTRNFALYNMTDGFGWNEE